MSLPSDTSFWLNLFIEAGIPANISTEYAMAFIDNRIKEDMLQDLNKDYLKEMGITVLGDIIAILKQAKIHSSRFKSRISSIRKEVKAKKECSKTNDVARRIINRYVRNESPLSKRKYNNYAEDDELDCNEPLDDLVSSTTESQTVTMTIKGKPVKRSRNDYNESDDVPQRQLVKLKSPGLEYHGILKKSNKYAEPFNRTVFEKSPNADIRERLGKFVTSQRSEGILKYDEQPSTSYTKAINNSDITRTVIVNPTNDNSKKVKRKVSIIKQNKHS